jgi:APA family basic amino acid/polyamine antiporter
MTARTAGVTLLPATAIVVGNMVGTGIFTSLGFQVADIQSGLPIGR